MSTPNQRNTAYEHFQQRLQILSRVQGRLYHGEIDDPKDDEHFAEAMDISQRIEVRVDLSSYDWYTVFFDNEGEWIEGYYHRIGEGYEEFKLEEEQTQLVVNVYDLGVR